MLNSHQCSLRLHDQISKPAMKVWHAGAMAHESRQHKSIGPIWVFLEKKKPTELMDCLYSKYSEVCDARNLSREEYIVSKDHSFRTTVPVSLNPKKVWLLDEAILYRAPPILALETTLDPSTYKLFTMFVKNLGARKFTYIHRSLRWIKVIGYIITFPTKIIFLKNTIKKKWRFS